MAVLAIGQPALVWVAFPGDYRVFIDRCAVADDQLPVFSQRITESLGENNFKSAAIRDLAAGSYGIGTVRHSISIQGDGNISGAAVIQSQASGHFIMEYVVLRTGLGNNGAPEVDNVADIRIVDPAKGLRGVLLHLLVVRWHTVLFLHCNIWHGRIQSTQNAQAGIHQVIAEFKALELHRSPGSRHPALIVAERSRIDLGLFGKFRRICARLPGDISLPIDIRIVPAGGRSRCGVCKESFPRRVHRIGNGLKGIVMRQVKNTINRIGLAHDGIVDGNTSGSGCSIGKSRGGKSQNQGQRQEQRKNFRDFFHHIRFLTFQNSCTYSVHSFQSCCPSLLFRRHMANAAARSMVPVTANPVSPPPPVSGST